MRGRESVLSKRASKQFERRCTSGSASGVADAARGATAGRRRSRTAWEVASSAQTTRIVQPCLFWSLRDATARSCPWSGVSQRCDVPRAIYHCAQRVWLRVGPSTYSFASRIDRRMGQTGGEGAITTCTRPYSTYSSLLYLSSTGFTPRDHIDDGIECFGATGRSSRATE